MSIITFRSPGISTNSPHFRHLPSEWGYVAAIGALFHATATNSHTVAATMPSIPAALNHPAMPRSQDRRASWDTHRITATTTAGSRTSRTSR